MTQFYLLILTDLPPLSLNLSEYNFQSGWKISPFDSSSDSEANDSPIRPTVDVPPSNEYVSETELKLFLSDTELFENDQHQIVSSSSDSEEIFLGTINPVQIESDKSCNLADVEQTSSECSKQNFVTKYCIDCKQELTILPLCRKCYHKKFINFPKRKLNRKNKKKILWYSGTTERAINWYLKIYT